MGMLEVMSRQKPIWSPTLSKAGSTPFYAFVVSNRNFLSGGST